MKTITTRKIVKIDESKCDGCGLCVPSCADGAIRIIDGKARLVVEDLCDGLGACLGTCPQDAITIEERPAEAFDEHAAREDSPQPKTSERQPLTPLPRGCPGTMAQALSPTLSKQQPTGPGGALAASQAEEKEQRTASRPSRLSYWPVQLALAPPRGPMWQDADVLIAADCVPFALADFHERLLAGKSLAIACPKLDDVGPYVEKLAAIFAGNNVKSVTVAHMEVPCCGGIVRVVRAALEQAGRTDIPVRDVTVGIDGVIKSEIED